MSDIFQQTEKELLLLQGAHSSDRRWIYDETWRS